MGNRLAWGAALALVGCGGAPSRSEPAAPIAKSQSGEATVTFEQEVSYLRQHGDVEVVEESRGGRIAISRDYQARVMTSAVGPGKRSLGFVNHAFIDAGKTGTQFDNYGGEDRFWLGPEGGQYGLYFPAGKPFVIGSWQTPHAMQEGRWDQAAQGVFTRAMRVASYAGTSFDVGVAREIRLLSSADVASRLGVAPPAGVQWVAFESVNTITNKGATAWEKSAGLVSVWILGMYKPAPDMKVLIPFSRGDGAVVNDRYFGKVPPDRLKVHDDAGYLEFSCDGHYRSKIGIGPARAKAVLGSYSAAEGLLTIVQLDKPPGARDYVNSMWEQQADPYGGDVVNSYNDGPTEPGKPSLGGFYELETSSPAAALAPGASTTHAHRTFHFVGDRAALDAIAVHVLGISLVR